MKNILLISVFFVCVAKSQTQFGIICGTCNDQIAAAQAVGVNWIRPTAFSLDDYKGDSVLKKYYNAGINVIETLKWENNAQDTFLTDTSRYKKALESFITNNLPPDTSLHLWLVICNEEENQHHNYGSAQDYLNELNAAITVAKKYNLNISDGGMTFQELMLLCYVNKMDARLWDKANKFGSMCIPQSSITQLQNPESHFWDDLDFLDSVITGLAKITYKNFYVNFHYYAPALYRKSHDTATINAVTFDSSYILTTMTDWLRQRTLRDSLHIICNEMGQINVSGDLLKSELRSALKSNVPMIIWRSGDETDKNGTVAAKGLFSDPNTLELRDNGEDFKNFVSKHGTPPPQKTTGFQFQ
jgi:hypothetical protein